MKQETIEESAEKWVFETNSHKWSNNDDTVGDNYGSFIAGSKWQQGRSYSKEDIREAFLAGVDKESYRGLNFDEWFEQFKTTK